MSYFKQIKLNKDLQLQFGYIQGGQDKTSKIPKKTNKLFWVKNRLSNPDNTKKLSK